MLRLYTPSYVLQHITEVMLRIDLCSVGPEEPSPTKAHRENRHHI